jgi:aspartyl/glutamyl-tRNA(Asn/Gln) amidotransferase C subunit
MPKAQKKGSVDAAEVERLASLSRISLGGPEKERLRAELSPILEYFATLDRLDLTKAPLPSSGMPDGRAREDMVEPSSPDSLLSGVPQKKGRYVRAPRVF